MTFLEKIAPYRSLFVILTGVMMFFSYRMIEKKNAGRSSKFVFWLFAGISLLVLYYPTILAFVR